MIQNNRNRLILIVVGILTIINIAVLATMWVHVNRFHAKEGMPPPIPLLEEGRDSVAFSSGHAFFIEELGFSETQQSDFRDSRQRFKADAKPLFSEIRQLNSLLIEEIIKESPDQSKLDGISSQTGALHSKVKQLTIKHLLEVKAIATPQQQEKLVFFYRDLLSRESGQAGRGMQYRHGQKRNGNK
ncbi:MAG: periplasmic heavy metal sensor [Lentimicrobium sp.]|nr:periplasmic heavy metal sensor [Lentimicrobium sp.]